jgi:hypothetical protein
VPKRLFQIRRSKHVTRSVQVPLACSSLNDGDAFVLDAGATIYTWFGTQSPPFEKERTAQMAHNLAEQRHGHAQVIVDVGDECHKFWELLGGKGEIQAPSPADDEELLEQETKLYVLSMLHVLPWRDTTLPLLIIMVSRRIIMLRRKQKHNP